MDENYLNQLLGGNYFTSSDVTMNYPITGHGVPVWTSTSTALMDPNMVIELQDYIQPFSKKEVSFIKKEIPKFNILTLQYKI